MIYGHGFAGEEDCERISGFPEVWCNMNAREESVYMNTKELGEKEAKDMTGDELNCMIAELCGAKWMLLIPTSGKKRSLVMPESVFSLKTLGLTEADGTEEICQIHWLPNYAGDLNAMHKAVLLLDESQKSLYRNTLIGMCEGMNSRNWAAIDATARQRAEAFVMAREGK